MRKRIAIAVVVLTGIAVAVPFAVTAQAPADDAALSRVERAFGPLGWICIDWCGGYALGVTTPADVAKVDVVVTATIAYRLSSGVRARARLGWWASRGPAFHPLTTPLRPGSYPLAPTGGRPETETLTWIVRGLPAHGQAYGLILEITTNARSFAPVAFSKKAAMVAEVWSAGAS